MGHRSGAALALLVTAAAALAPSVASSAPKPIAPYGTFGGDNFPGSLALHEQGLRQRALESGDVIRRGSVVKLGREFVNLRREGTDRALVVLAEFTAGRGPLHNAIPRPNRKKSNGFNWRSNFNQVYYKKFAFGSSASDESMHNYYIQQSSNRYSLTGEVTPWVQVAQEEAFYGTDDCDGDGDIDAQVCGQAAFLIRDSLAAWAAAADPATLANTAQSIDIYDRYDCDGDGEFNEPDGYLDHLIIVHAGEGEEDLLRGGPQGTDALWSHRSYANLGAAGTQGPPGCMLGGYPIPGTDIWAGDYTIQPENGGLGVYVHEFGHDLGLPDEYDTAGTDSPAAFWTLMASGSNSGYAKHNRGLGGLQTRPTHMNTWDKLVLGWLDFVDVPVGATSADVTLGPAEGTARNGALQAVRVQLPPRAHQVVITEPIDGTHFWWSGQGHDRTTTLSHAVTLTAGQPAALQAKTWYDIEEDFDYAYVEVSADGGSTWTAVETNRSTTTNPNGNNSGFGITGNSGGWVDLTADLSAYAGQTVDLRFRYTQDPAAQGLGFAVDAINVTSGGTTVLSDDVESGADDWTATSTVAPAFQIIDGSITIISTQYYLAENRQYLGWDKSLRYGPYASGAGTPQATINPLMVQHFPYMDGMLVHYRDNFWTDNNVSEHPGEGAILPIDAHPDPLLQASGNVWRTRITMYDATFGLEPTEALTLASNDASGTTTDVTYPSLPAVPAFDDRANWFLPSAPLNTVKTPALGITIGVTGQSDDGWYLGVHVDRAAS